MNPPAITSLANPRIRAWVRLRDRRERYRTGRTLVDGLREIGRALDAGAALEEVVVGPAADGSADQALSSVSGGGDPFVGVSAGGSAPASGTGGGLVAVVGSRRCLSTTSRSGRSLVLIVGVEKQPGAVLRPRRRRG
jgi:hypothetical protein